MKFFAIKVVLLFLILPSAFAQESNSILVFYFKDSNFNNGHGSAARFCDQRITNYFYFFWDPSNKK